MCATAAATSRQLTLIERFTRVSVLVVGDAMLDTYLTAPAADDLGGAANVARNAAGLGSRATIVGVVGDDDAGRTLSRLLTESGVSQLLETDSSRPTTRKVRVTDDEGRELVRADRESDAALSEELADRLTRRIESVVDEHDVLVCSDYSKGVFANSALERCIRFGQRARIPVVVAPRPKRGDYLAAVRGATLLVVNAAEARYLTGSVGDGNEAVARRLSERAGAAVVVTLGADGMIACADDDVFTMPGHESEVVCPIGAGDTVAACLAAGLAAGSPLIDAADVANRAAAVVVAKPRTAAVTADELRLSF